MPRNMEHHKSKAAISKLKSSNSAIENKKKTESHKKKSKSNVEIETLELKKRGVYVEKNKTSIFGRDLDAADEMKEEIQEKPHKRQHRDHKKFLASVLTILSKSSTVAHQQDSSNSKAKKDESKAKVSPKHTLESIPSLFPPYALDYDLDKKRKYRSKILNGYKRQVDNFEILQSKKERFHTSSNSSINDKEDTKWKSELPRLVPPSPEEIQDDDKYKTLVREVTEGKKLAEKKNKVFDPDPPTLVSEQASHMDDKKLYNFFVDLLQSTFNVYNVNTHYDKRPVPSAVSSKIGLEIDEAVARKLNVATEMHKENERTKPFDYSIRNEHERWIDNSSQNNTHIYNRISKYTRVNREPPNSAGKQTKTRKDYEPRRILSSRPQNAEYNIAEERPSFYRKQKKRALLNMLKEELRMDPVSFEEPQNLYEALRVMAQQKRKTIPEKNLRFQKKTSQISGKCPAECKLLKGRRSVLNKKARKRNEDVTLNHGAIGKKTSELGHRKILQQPYNTEEYSNHSLQVYSFEKFVPNSSNKRENVLLKKRRRRRMMYESYPEEIYSSEEEL